MAESTEAGRPGWIVIEPESGLSSLRLGELWAYRELLGFFAWRDISVRYKQSVLGVLWALLTPLVTVGIFTLIFGRIANIPSDGIPYPVFCYAGLLPWLFFAQSVQRATVSMVAERNLLTKVYFPRLIVPISSTLAPLVDLAIASSVLAAMMAWYGVGPDARTASTWSRSAWPGHGSWRSASARCSRRSTCTSATWGR